MTARRQRARVVPQDEVPARRVLGREAASRPVSASTTGPSNAAPIRSLQRTLGNAAVVRLLTAQRAPAPAASDPERAGAAVRGVLGSPGRPLPEAVRTEMEAGFGADFSGVRIHTGPAAARSAAAVAARAYTSGSHIVLDRYSGNRHVLAHELAHVLQQRRGPVDGGAHPGGLRLSDPGDRFERAAEVSARQVLSGSARRPGGSAAQAGPHGTAGAGGSPAGGAVAVVQRWRDGTITCDEPTFTESQGRAGTVEVHNLRGIPLAPSANQPSKNPVGWQQLQGANLVKGGDEPQHAPYNAVRMHLWNGRLGGPGNDARNLAPGPGKINSLMSARAETPVKFLVECGNTIWLRTAVTYQNDKVNASDFTSVVPNCITMQWGVEGDPRTNGSWRAAIPLPIDPLQKEQADAFRQWDAADGAGLIVRLEGETEQVRAQVLGLVRPELVPAILRKWPVMFVEMAPSARAYLVLGISNAGSSQEAAAGFLTDLHLNADDLPELVVYPLSSMRQPDLAADLFLRLVPDEADRARIIVRQEQERQKKQGEEKQGEQKQGTSLTDILGSRIDKQAMTDTKVFNAINKFDQIRLFDTMVIRNKVSTFLGGMPTSKDGAKLLDRVALFHNCTTTNQRLEFVEYIKGDVPPAIMKAFRTRSKNHTAAESNTRSTRSGTKRNAGATKKIDKRKK